MHARRTTLITGTALLALAAGCSSDSAAQAAATTGATTTGTSTTASSTTTTTATSDVGWDPVPDAGTYDPCRTLTAATVTVDGATGGSPEAVLLFHEGAFVGTATPQPYGLTTLDTAASTADTVAVDYRYVQPGESNASASGLATVRYRWVDGAVRALDTLPPEITS